ncbi:MAG: hypothetical protein FJ279_21155 [Planctomycetes bacterium]|nr:hypothetical protein [Planctomycetota bacterium]
MASVARAFLLPGHGSLLWMMMECSEEDRQRLYQKPEAQYRAFGLQDLKPVLEWRGAHTVYRLYYALELEPTPSAEGQNGQLKLQVDVKRKPGIVPATAGLRPESSVTDYFLAYTWPVRVVEVAPKGRRKPDAPVRLEKQLRIVPARGMVQHKERLWDAEKLLNTVPAEDRRGIERVFEQYPASPEAYLKFHAKKFEWPKPLAARAAERGGHWGLLEFQVKQGLPWLPRPVEATRRADSHRDAPKPAGEQRGRPPQQPWLRLTPKKIDPLGPDKAHVTVEYVSQEYMETGQGENRLVSRCDPDSEWILVKEEGEWKIVTYMLEWWRPPDGQMTGDR